MKTYIVIIKICEEKMNYFVTSDYKAALEFILSLSFDLLRRFSTLEIWGKGYIKYAYGSSAFDTLPKLGTSVDELDKYIQEHINRTDERRWKTFCKVGS